MTRYFLRPDHPEITAYYHIEGTPGAFRWYWEETGEEPDFSRDAYPTLSDALTAAADDARDNIARVEERAKLVAKLRAASTRARKAGR